MVFECTNIASKDLQPLFLENRKQSLKKKSKGRGGICACGVCKNGFTEHLNAHAALAFNIMESRDWPLTILREPLPSGHDQRSLARRSPKTKCADKFCTLRVEAYRFANPRARILVFRSELVLDDTAASSVRTWSSFARWRIFI